MAENIDESRLLWDWHNEKGNIESFLADPLKWVADELEKACHGLIVSLSSRPIRKSDLETIETLTDIIRFINANNKLLMANK